MTDPAPAPQQPQSVQLPPAQPQPQAQEQAPPPPTQPPEDADKDPAEDKSDTALLKASVTDAYILMDFAVRRGIKPEGAISTPIIESYDAVQNDKPLSTDTENAFWLAFSKVVELVHPVTIRSIRYTSTSPALTDAPIWKRLFQSQSPADRVLKRYLFIAVMSLLGLLAIQVEWAIGMSIYNDAFTVHANLQSSQDKTAKTSALDTALQDSTATAVRNQTSAELLALQNQLSQNEIWNNVSYVRLWWWNRHVTALLPPYGGKALKGPPQEAGHLQLKDEGLRRIEFTRAQLTLEVLSNYVLVALFALLGSMTQALRTLSNEINAVTLTAKTLYGIRTRIILGVISGVCMAWLLIISSAPAAPGDAPPASPLAAISFLGAFTPWALAFVSGYSVEIFFAALERFIAYTTSRIQGAPPPPPGKDDGGAHKAPPPQSPEPSPSTGATSQSSTTQI